MKNEYSDTQSENIYWNFLKISGRKSEFSALTIPSTLHVQKVIDWHWLFMTFFIKIDFSSFATVHKLMKSKRDVSSTWTFPFCALQRNFDGKTLSKIIIVMKWVGVHTRNWYFGDLDILADLDLVKYYNEHNFSWILISFG